MAGRGEGYFHRAIYGTGGSLLIPEDRSGKPLRLSQRRDGRDTAADDLLALVPDLLHALRRGEATTPAPRRAAPERNPRRPTARVVE